MARTLRVPLYPGAFYHVISHVLPDTPLYRLDDDRVHFLRLLRDVVQRHAWDSFAWCLMDTHYHALLRTPAADLDVGMKRLNGCYAQAFNRRHGRRGHLFEGRYWSAHVQTDAHFRWVVRYIARNPVEAGACRDPVEWRWSSFRQTLERDAAGLVPTVSVLRFFGGAERLAAFVYSDDEEPPPEFVTKL